MKPQETPFQERGWAQGGLGASGRHRKTARLLDIWNWGGGVSLGELGPGTFPGPLPGRYEDLSESASLAGIHRGVAVTVRWPGGHRTWGGPFSHSTKPHANSPEPDILSALKTFC